MEMKDVICSDERGYLGGALTAVGQYQAMQESPEVLAKMRAEREECERRHKRQIKVGAIVDIATALVKVGTEPTLALETAETFYRRSKEFAEKFSE